MPERNFRAFEQRLVDGGVIPACARRLADELDGHWQDLCDEARARGLADDEMRRYADDRVGRDPELLAAVLARRDLKRWMYRYPNFARIALPLAYASLLPAAASVTHAPLIARWSACLTLSALFTGSLMLVLYLAILVT